MNQAPAGNACRGREPTDTARVKSTATTATTATCAHRAAIQGASTTCRGAGAVTVAGLSVKRPARVAGTAR
ncbi:hypothetical protein Shyhy01_59960 [Streptomyces hygroscopicus subsp. hygroscopicus]|nr:hypothetical protein Shyhy01_59960 [Streptomyces hygroscopicus subsp. hygroscopicus]